MNDEQAWKSTVARELGRRAGDLDEAPLTLERVRGHARTLRRRRRVAVAGGVLTVAAVLAPAALLATGVGEGGDSAPAVPGPSGTGDDRGADPRPPAEQITGPPRVPYLEGTTWHRPDGSITELAERYDGGVVVGDLLVAVRRDGSGRLVAQPLGEDGTPMGDPTGTLSGPVADDDHSAFAYVDRRGGLAVVPVEQGARAEDPLGLGLRDGDTVAALTGAVGCDEPAGCLAYVNHGDLRPAEVVDLDRRVATPLSPRVIKVNDATDAGVVAAQTSYSVDGSCSVVAEPGGDLRFETCRQSFYGFSPDGAHLSATDAYRDALGPAYVTIRDAADGREVARLDAPRGGFLGDPVWEDEAHLLVPAYAGGEWQVHRLRVDGTSEQLLASRAGDEVTPAFVLLDPA